VDIDGERIHSASRHQPQRLIRFCGSSPVLREFPNRLVAVSARAVNWSGAALPKFCHCWPRLKPLSQTACYDVGEELRCGGSCDTEVPDAAHMIGPPDRSSHDRASLFLQRTGKFVSLSMERRRLVSAYSDNNVAAFSVGVNQHRRSPPDKRQQVHDFACKIAIRAGSLSASVVTPPDFNFVYVNQCITQNRQGSTFDAVSHIWL